MALVLENIKAHRGSFQLSLPHLEARPGEILGISGPSGSGKSTLFDVISGFLPLDAGKILFEEKRLDLLPTEERKVALVFQRGTLFPHLNVRENIEYALKIQGASKEARASIAGEWLKKMGMAELGHRRLHELSGGQAQRVSIARALAASFPILLLDEPMSGLDQSLARELEETIVSEVKKKSIVCLWITHDPSQVERFESQFRRAPLMLQSPENP